jgi:hypothetical protein
MQKRGSESWLDCRYSAGPVASAPCAQRSSLAALGTMPPESQDEALWARWHQVVEALPAPATDEEARAAASALPSDDSTGFGLAWGLVHFIESAPGWPLSDVVAGDGPWLSFLRDRADRELA